MAAAFGRLAKGVAAMFDVWGSAYRRLAESHALAVVGDAAVAVALAGTLFFTVPATDARENVALYLLLTLAPFAVVGPFLGRLFERMPGAYRGSLAASGLGRAAVALGMIWTRESLWLFPLAFGLLVLSRLGGIARSSVLPVVVGDPNALVAANARLARIGVLAGGIGGAVVAFLVAVGGPPLGLVPAAVAFVASAVAAVQLPRLRVVPRGRDRGPRRLPRRVRLALFATGGVRFLNGFLLLLFAFALRDLAAGVASLGLFLGAAGAGYFLAAWAAPAIGGYVTEEPMVVAALAVEAGAAFIAGQVFDVGSLTVLVAAVVLAGAAGFAWGTAKFGFDGLLQASMPVDARGRAFTFAESVLQLAWVFGALLPVLPILPTGLGLAGAGVAALVIQVVYVTLVLLPEAAGRRRDPDAAPPPERRGDQGVLDLL